jgi:hypothetical protein
MLSCTFEGAGQHYTWRVAGICARGTSERRVPVYEVISGILIQDAASSYGLVDRWLRGGGVLR